MDHSCSWIILSLGLMAGMGQPLTARQNPVESQTTAKIETIEDLWAGFDPRALPLETEVLKSWDEDDLHFEMFYFTGEEFEGKKTRIFGYLGRPKKPEGKIPGLIHVHGGGQTAVLDWPRFWAKRGYACVSFDFCGDTSMLGPKSKREHYTRWGKVPADMFKISGGLQMTPTPRHNPWYHWTLAARRALTLLEARPEVDKDRLGVFGISVGGTLTWSIASLDHRIKAAAPIYGCGWEFYPYPPDLKAPVGEDLRLWRKLIAPEAHAARIRCPLHFLSATNDFHGRMDLAYHTLAQLGSSQKSLVFTRNYNHHVEPDEGHSLPEFFATHFHGNRPAWPMTPTVQVKESQMGIPLVRVKASNLDRVERVEINYCLNNASPTGRFWRRGESPMPDGNTFVASAPYLSESDTLFVFANVYYKSGACVSSALIKQDAANIPNARPTLKPQNLIDAMDDASNWHWVPAYTDPCRYDRFFVDWSGPSLAICFTLDPKTFGHAGAMHYHFGTRKIGDPQFQGVDPAKKTNATGKEGTKLLLIDFATENRPEQLTVRLTRREPGQNEVEFTAKISFPQAKKGDWQTISMKMEEFRDAQQKVLPNWEHLELFALDGVNPAKKPPIFKRLRWAFEK